MKGASDHLTVSVESRDRRRAEAMKSKLNKYLCYVCPATETVQRPALLSSPTSCLLTRDRDLSHRQRMSKSFSQEKISFHHTFIVVIGIASINNFLSPNELHSYYAHAALLITVIAITSSTSYCHLSPMRRQIIRHKVG